MFTVLPIWALTRTVFGSILEVFVLCVAGYILARKGILDKKTQKQINRLNVSLFTPSLLFSKVAFFLSPQKLRELWIIPIFFIIVTICSMLVAFFLSFMFRLKPSQRSFAVASSMFMNSNSLPIALMQSLVVTVPALKWDDDDNKNVMLGRALTYLVLYSTLGMIVRWSYGVKLLSQADPEEPETAAEDTESRLPGDLLLPESGMSESQTTLHPSNSSESLSDMENTPVIHISVHGPTLQADRPRVFYSFPNTPSGSTARLPQPENSSDYGTDNEGDGLPSQRPVTEPTRTRFQSTMRRTKRSIVRALVTFNDFMSVPLWASLASLIVACVRPLQYAMEQHMHPIKGALTQAGNCSIPLTLVVLGAYFYIPPSKGEEEQAIARARRRSMSTSTATTTSRLSFGSFRDMFKMNNSRPSRERSMSMMAREKQKKGETKTVVIAVLSRMVITPLLLLPLMALCALYDWHHVFSDPVFVVANVLLVASPPALTLAQITQAASGDAFERLISRTIFWSYCVLTPPATIIYVVIGLILAKL